MRRPWSAPFPFFPKVKVVRAEGTLKRMKTYPFTSWWPRHCQTEVMGIHIMYAHTYLIYIYIYIASYHIISYHIISYHIISYHIIYIYIYIIIYIYIRVPRSPFIHLHSLFTSSLDTCDTLLQVVGPKKNKQSPGPRRAILMADQHLMIPIFGWNELPLLPQLPAMLGCSLVFAEG